MKKLKTYENFSEKLPNDKCYTLDDLKAAFEAGHKQVWEGLEQTTI